MEEMKLKKDEHIDFIAVTFSEEGAHTLCFKTNQNQVLMAEGES
jgi:hypothetical protein